MSKSHLKESYPDKKHPPSDRPLHTAVTGNYIDEFTPDKFEDTKILNEVRKDVRSGETYNHNPCLAKFKSGPENAIQEGPG